MKKSQPSAHGRTATQQHVLDLCLIALMMALMSVCAWISIPTPWEISFTLQTFAVFTAVGLLGWKRGTIATALYILLGAVGAPVFSNFGGGIGKLLGPTGGYILGFLLSALVTGLILKFAGDRWWVMLLADIAGLIICYLFGTVWFMVVYTQTSAISLWAVLGMCVIPYIIPDLAKIALSLAITKGVRSRIRL